MEKPRPAIFALLSAVATYLFWIEYLPPFKKVRLYSDIEGFHWPLLVSAFEAIRHGRFPLWDPSIYCGMPFAGNIQAALFYPPVWLLFVANLRSSHLLFKTLEAWIFLHSWLAFFLTYRWLLGRRLSPLASILGASAFAFGGYMVSQNNHVGVVTGYTWTPLAWLGVDEAFEKRSWRPLWKVVAASALCFLAGYTASFVAFAIATTVYAAARSWRLGIATVLAIVASFAVSAIELLPATETAAMKTFDPKYGSGIMDPLFYINFLLPDWAGFTFGDPYLYLYLGIPVLFGILWLRKPDRAALAVLAVSALFLTNPLDLISNQIAKSPFLVQVFPMLNFVEPATLAFAFIAARGIDGFLQSKSGVEATWLRRRWFGFATAVLLVAWSLYRLWIWPAPVSGWRSATETIVMLVLFCAGLFAVRKGRTWLAILLCAAIFVDYKVAGTSRPFSAAPGDVEPYFPRGLMPGVDTRTFDALRANRQYRLALVDGIHSTDLRRYGLATPQGFDPLLSAQYKAFIEKSKPFRTNRVFELGPSDETILQKLGVRYLASHEGFPPNDNLRLMGTGDTFLKIYEYTRAKPPWAWEGEAQVLRWEPELREFQVGSPGGGTFVLIEQFYPGWRGSVDGASIGIDRWEGVFQSIAIPAGEHTVRFEYQPLSLILGAVISAAALLGLVFSLWVTRENTDRANRTPVLD